MQRRQWSDADFESMSWHDSHVHGLRVVEGEHGTGDLELDLDYILEWRRGASAYSFVVVPVVLRFHEVFRLRVAIDWGATSAAHGPFSLGEVERRIEKREHYTATLWRLEVNWPAGVLEFEAVGFTQEAWGREVASDRQVLSAVQRVAV